MRKYKMALCLVLAVMMAGFTFFTDYSNQAKLLFLVVGLLAIAFLSRGNAVYAKASKIIARRNPNELAHAISLMEKALDLGCSENYTVIAATLVLQHGDMEKARENLEEKTNSGSKNIRSSAKSSLSMYYYMKGDIDKAIKLAEEAKQERSKNANLYANLCLYYLANNDKRNYRRTLNEAFSKDATSLALIDIQATYFILQGEYAKAGYTLNKLFSQMTPTYPDPYIHFAMVYLKYGHVGDAIKMLEDSLYSSFTNTSLLQKEDIETMISGLKDPRSRIKWTLAINSDKTLSIKHHLPRIKEEEKTEETSAPVLPGFPSLPNFNDESLEKEIAKRNLDEDEVNTALTEEDDEWLKKHNF